MWPNPPIFLPVRRYMNAAQPWYDTLFTIVTVQGLFISLEENVTFACNFFMTRSQWSNQPPLTAELSQSFQYFILSSRPLFLTRPESSKPTKCLVLYFSCSLRPSNIQRIGLEHSGLPSLAFKITLMWHPAAPQKHMHISGAVTWGWCKGRVPWGLAKARPEMMTHTAKQM